MSSDNPQSEDRPSVVYFDEDGDTRLLLTREKHNQIYVVSSQAMSLVCRAWKRMLSAESGFKEASLVGSHGAIPLPDDDPEALGLLLNITHMHFDLVPDVLDFWTLLSVAELTEKYGALKIIRPWIKGWIKAVEHLVESPGYEEWLFIAWAFGENEIFDRLSLRLLRQVHVNELGQCVTPTGRILDPSSDTALLPPEIIENIVKLRTAAVRRVLRIIYDRVDRYLNPTSYSTSHVCIDGNFVEDAHNCDALNLGALILALSRIGLGPQQKKEAEVTESLKDLAGRLVNMMQQYLKYSLPRNGRVVYVHTGCTLKSTIEREVHFLKRIASPALPSHNSHMKQRQEELSSVNDRKRSEDQQASQLDAGNSKKRGRG